MIVMIDVVRIFNDISLEITKNGPKINEDLSENEITWKIENMKMKLKVMLSVLNFFNVRKSSSFHHGHLRQN